MMQRVEPAPSAKPRFLSKRWMISLAAFAGVYAAIVICGVVVQHKLNNDYRLSFRYPLWAERNGRYASLGDEAGVIRDSVNRVMNGAEVNSEWKTAFDARQDFDSQLLRDKADVKTLPDGADTAMLLSD